LVSNVPYAWQKSGQTIEITTNRGQGINVAGFLSADGTDFHAYTSQQSIQTQDVITYFDDFCKQIKQKTIVILDNAPAHRSELFLKQMTRWKEQDLFLFFLPPYSPELNKIEILWRVSKHQWLDFDAFLSLQNLKEQVRQMFVGFNKKYKINFV
jgi:hypothetical protein